MTWCRPGRSPRSPARARTRTRLAAGAAVAAALVAAPPGAHASSEASSDLPRDDDATALDPYGPYDPFEGVDRSGRIPAIEKPESLGHPERWRYIPEGRIKPGNVFERFLVSSFLVPLFFRDSDVGTGAGIALTDIDFRGQRRREFAGAFLTFTSEGQQNYAFVWRRWMHHIERPEGGVLQEERSFWRFSAGYSKTLTRRFFGIGSNTNERDESSYTDEFWRLRGGAELSLPDPRSNWVGRLEAVMELHELTSGRVSGEPDTRKAFPELFADADSADLGWLVAGLRYDTRDSRRNPYRGWHLGGLAEAALLRSDGEPAARYRLDGSFIQPLPGLFHRGAKGDEENPPTDTLALGASLSWVSGELPFFARPTLGGSNTLRGYIAGRWRDDAAWTAAAEYRFWVLPRGIPIYGPIRIERVGLAFFGETGAVAGHLKALTEAEARWSAGVGLRLTLERAAPFRVDVGFSDEGVQVTARFGLAF